MKELDPNTQLKNAIEEDKLQMELFKLTRSGRRATNQIDREEEGLTSHFLDVTCKTDRVTDNRKNKTFEIIEQAGRPMSARSPDKRPHSAVRRAKKVVRPATAAPFVHHIPAGSSGYDSDVESERVQLPLDPYGRPDFERLHREKSDKFYHTKIDKLMTMMSERTQRRRRRSKSAPATRSQPFNVHNIPATIPELKPAVSRGETEYQLKKLRASAMTRQPSLLYGEAREQIERQTSRPGTAAQNRRSSELGAGSRPGTAAARRRSSTAVNASPARRQSSFRLSITGGGSSDTSADELEETSPVVKDPASGYGSAHLDTLGVKLRHFQNLRLPSAFLDPNPDSVARQKPFPVILDKKEYVMWCQRVARIKTIAESRRDLEEVLRSAEERSNQVKPHPLYTLAAVAWDTGPKFA